MIEYPNIFDEEDSKQYFSQKSQSKTFKNNEEVKNYQDSLYLDNWNQILVQKGVTDLKYFKLEIDELS